MLSCVAESAAPSDNVRRHFSLCFQGFSNADDEPFVGLSWGRGAVAVDLLRRVRNEDMVWSRRRALSR